MPSPLNPVNIDSEKICTEALKLKGPTLTMERLDTDFIPKKVLFTGGCGFIGSNVLNYLVEEYPRTKFVNLDKLDYCGNPNNVYRISEECANYWFVQGDICDKKLVDRLFEQHQFDCVFHFAALSHVDRSFTSSEDFVLTNVNGTHTLLEAAIRCSTLKRFIHVSTDEVYGDLSFDENRRVHEQDQMVPTNPYSASKAAAECLVRGFSFSFRLPSIVVRPNNVFGPHQWPEKLIPKSIALFNQNRAFPIHGTGTNTRSFLFVEDVISAFDVLMRRGQPHETYNISQPVEKSNLDVLKSVLVALNKFPSIDDVDLKDPKYFTYVCDRAFNDKSYNTTSEKLEALGWKIQTSWEEGIKKTVDWYLSHPDHFGDIEEALQAHYGYLTKIGGTSPVCGNTKHHSNETGTSHGHVDNHNNNNNLNPSHHHANGPGVGSGHGHGSADDTESKNSSSHCNKFSKPLSEDGNLNLVNTFAPAFKEFAQGKKF